VLSVIRFCAHVCRQGNPFHLSTLLRSWHDQQLLTFDFATARWQWDLHQMRESAVQEDVVDVVCSQMLVLSAHAQTLLQYAACLGNTFHLHALQIITRMDVQQLTRGACELEAAGMLMVASGQHELFLLAEGQLRQPEALSSRSSTSTPLCAVGSSSYLPGTSTADEEESHPEVAGPSSVMSMLTGIVMKFQHDRIQQASHQLIPPGKLSAIHLTITEQLLSSYDEAECIEYANDIVSHVQAGCMDDVEDGAELYVSQSQINNFTPSVNADRSSLNVLSTSEPQPSITSKLANRVRWNRFLASGNVVEHLVQLEMLAGKQAKASGAYQSAIKLFESALKLVQWQTQYHEELIHRDGTEWHPAGQQEAEALFPLSPLESVSHEQVDFLQVKSACWLFHYAAVFAIYTEMSSTLFQISSFCQTQLCVEYALSHARTMTDRSTLFELRISAVVQQGRMAEAVQLGLRHLQDLHVALYSDDVSDPNDPLLHWILTFEDLDDEATFKHHPIFLLEEAADPLTQVKMQLLTAIIPALFYLNSPQFLSINLTMLELTMREGLTPESAFAFGLFNIIVWGSHKQYKESFALGYSSLLLLDHLADTGRTVSVRTKCAVYAHSYTWRKPLRVVFALEEELFQEAMDAGDTEWGSYVAMYVCDLMLACNTPILLSLTKLHTLVHTLQKKKMNITLQYVNYWLRFIETFGGVPDVQAPKSIGESTGSLLSQMVVGRRTSDGMLNYLLRRLPEALVHFRASALVIAAVRSLPVNIAETFYRCLTLLASAKVGTLRCTEDSQINDLPADYNASATMEILVEADSLIALLDVWTVHAPHNFAMKLALAKAERNRVAIFSHLSMHHLAMRTQMLYSQAAVLARTDKFLLEEALALELGARFFQHSLQPDIARTLLTHSYLLYVQYGAMAKAVQMCAEWPHESLRDSILTGNSMYPPVKHSSHPSKMLNQPPSVSSRLSGLGSPLQSGLISVGSTQSMPLTRNHLQNSLDGNRSTSGVASYIYPLSSMDEAVSADTHSERSSASQLAELTYASSGIVLSLASSSADISSSSQARHHTACQSGESNYDDSYRFPQVSQNLQGNVPMYPQPQLIHATDGSILSPSSVVRTLQQSGSNGSASSFDAMAVLKATASWSTEKDQATLLARLMSIVLETAGATRGVLVLQDNAGDWRIELGGSVAGVTEDRPADESSKHDGTGHLIEEHKPASLPSAGKLTGSEIASKMRCVIPGSSGGPDAFSLSTSTPLAPLSDFANTPRSSSTRPVGYHPTSSQISVTSGPSTRSGYQSEQHSQLSSGTRLRLEAEEIRTCATAVPQTSHARDMGGTMAMGSALPESVFQYCVSSVETVVLLEPVSGVHGSDPYFQDPVHRPLACLCMPVLKVC
jgi:predicted ATPase